MWSKFAEVQRAFAVAEVRKVTANLSQTCGFAVAEHLLQFCGICGCGIECKFAVPSSEHYYQTENQSIIFVMAVGLLKTEKRNLYTASCCTGALTRLQK